jgi:hypothetical protein
VRAAPPPPPAAPPKKRAFHLTDGSAMEDSVVAHMGRVIATLAPLIAGSQRGGFLINATRMFNGEGLAQVVGGRSREGEATAKLQSERRDTIHYAVGYYYGATSQGAKKAAAVRAKNASKMPLPPSAPARLNQSPRTPKRLFVIRRPEGEFNIPTTYRNWDRRAEVADSESPRYGGAYAGESVAAM